MKQPTSKTPKRLEHEKSRPATSQNASQMEDSKHEKKKEEKHKEKEKEKSKEKEKEIKQLPSKTPTEGENEGEPVAADQLELLNRAQSMERDEKIDPYDNLGPRVKAGSVKAGSVKAGSISFKTPPNEAQNVDQPVLAVDQPVVVRKPVVRQAQSKSSASGMGVPITNEDLILLQQAERLLKEKSAYDNDEPEAALREDGQEHKVTRKNNDPNKTAIPLLPVEPCRLRPLQRTQGLSEKQDIANRTRSKMLTARCPVIAKCSKNNLAARQAAQQQVVTQPTPQHTPSRRLALNSIQTKPSPLQQSPLKPVPSSPAVAKQVPMSPVVGMRTPPSPVTARLAPLRPAAGKQPPQSPAIAKWAPQSPAAAGKQPPQSPAIAKRTPQSPAVAKQTLNAQGTPKPNIARPAPVQAQVKPTLQQQALKPKVITPATQSSRQPIAKQLPQRPVVKKALHQKEVKEEKQVHSDFLAF
ncbi:hypothetical protein Aduo_004279 [Ancylostoma duodenale]